MPSVAVVVDGCPLARWRRSRASSAAATSAAEAALSGSAGWGVARRGGCADHLAGTVLNRRGMAELPEQRNQLILIDGSDQDTRGDGAEPQLRGSRMSQQRRRLCLVGQPDIAAGRANANAAVAPRHVADQVARGWGTSVVECRSSQSCTSAADQPMSKARRSEVALNR